MLAHLKRMHEKLPLSYKKYAYIRAMGAMVFNRNMRVGQLVQRYEDFARRTYSEQVVFDLPQELQDMVFSMIIGSLKLCNFSIDGFPPSISSPNWSEMNAFEQALYSMGWLKDGGADSDHKIYVAPYLDPKAVSPKFLHRLGRFWYSRVRFNFGRNTHLLFHYLQCDVVDIGARPCDFITHVELDIIPPIHFYGIPWSYGNRSEAPDLGTYQRQLRCLHGLKSPKYIGIRIFMNHHTKWQIRAPLEVCLDRLKYLFPLLRSLRKPGLRLDITLYDRSSDYTRRNKRSLLLPQEWQSRFQDALQKF